MTLIFESSPGILEVTLRDGSYLIDFQFTAEDTAFLASVLEAAGFKWIEVGHGLGLNASNAGKGVAAATDEEYLDATAQALKSARWGMFFIPGIGREEDLRLAAKYKMSFVRIGTNITELESARSYFELAKELGFIVSYNAMKSYAVPPVEFGRKAAQAGSWGADIVYLVDSAGGMYPDDVSSYFKAVKEQSDVALGFHGHDNLALAMANTLRAIDEGAALVDTSLQGMGRSAGNAVTEVLVAILKNRGQLAGVDLKAVMDIGQGAIHPLMRQRGLDPMAVTAGYARFHSSFTSKVQRFAAKYNLDVRDLIVRLCQEDQVSAPDDLLEQLGKELAAEKTRPRIRVSAFAAGRRKETLGRDALLSSLKEIRPQSIKQGKHSVVNIVTGVAPQEDFYVSRNVHESRGYVVGSVVVTSSAQRASALSLLDGKVDIVLLDIDPKPFMLSMSEATPTPKLEKSLLLTYLDSQVWVNAVEEQVTRILDDRLASLPVVIAGEHPRSRILAFRLAERGAHVSVLTGPAELSEDIASKVATVFSGQPESLHIEKFVCTSSEALERLERSRLTVVWPARNAWFDRSLAATLSELSHLVDARIGGLLPDAVDESRRRGVRVVRVNIWPTLAGALAAAHDSAMAIRNDMGWGNLDGVPVVAGGAVGAAGDVVIDSLKAPSRVIGIADGLGGVRFDFDDVSSERIRRVTGAINTWRIRPQLDGEG